MRDKFWKLYESVLKSERYYWHYRQRSIFFHHLIQAFLLIASLSSVAGLWFWTKIPGIWAIIALVAQVVSACAYMLPQSAQITALNYLLPELQRLLNQIDHDWDMLEELSPGDINDLVLKYNNDFCDMEDKYTCGVSFPARERVVRKADIDCRNYKFSHLDITQVDQVEEVFKNAE